MRVTAGFVASALTVALASASPAAAEKFLGKFDRWEAHRTGNGVDTVCFVASLPTKTEGKVAKRGEATIMIAHFPKRKAFGQVQVKAGFVLKKASTVELAIGPKRFKLTADGDSGYGDSAKENAEIVAALKAGNTAAATELAATGPKIVDTYSLAGFTKALAVIDKECGKK
jgi:hypothetical protein